MSTTTDPMRTHVHGMWASVAPQWAEHADFVDHRQAEVTTRLLAAAGVAPGMHVVELACGPGGTGLAAAELVGPTGSVVLSDVASQMVAIAAARAAERGCENVRTALLDLEDLDLSDAACAAVLCREGLMFSVDPARAVGEIHRVLRPDGRAAAAVWGPRELNPWLGLVFDAVSSELGMTLPPPGLPGPFALSDASGLRALFDDAGFVDVEVQAVDVPMRTSSFEEWWLRTSAIAGPLASIIAALDPAKRSCVEQRLREAAAPFTTSSGLDIPGVSLLVSARRG